MKIIISNLSDGKHDYEFCETPVTLDLEDCETEGDITVKAELQKYGGQIQVTVLFRGDFLYDCDRCVKKIKIELSNKFEVIYKFTKKAGETEVTDENIFFISPVTNNIDLKDIVREYMLLALPMRKVPPEEVTEFALTVNKDMKEILRIEIKLRR